MDPSAKPGQAKTDRRRFLELGTAVSLATLADLSIVSARGAAADHFARDEVGGSARERARLRLHTAVFDERFAAARHFGAAARRLGLAVHPIRGDVTELWYSRLYPLWRNSPAPVAGLTAYAAMFCLERLAWDHGLRMVQRDAHVGDGMTGQPLHSWLIASRAQMTAARA